MIKVSMFENAGSTYGFTVDIIDVLEAIGLGRWEERVGRVRACPDNKTKDSLKKDLPCVTFSGVFERRLDSSIKDYNGMYICDIDKLEPAEYSRAWRSIESDPHVFSMFRSTSGNGLKVIIHSDNTDPSLHKNKFKSLSDYMINTHGVTLDRSGSNISRLCFVSYDPVIHYNDQAECISLSVTGPATHRNWESTKLDKALRDGNIETDQRRIFKEIIKWAEEKGFKYRKGGRHNYLLYMCCSLNRAGVKENDIFNLIHSKHSLDDDMNKDLVRILQSIRESYSHEFLSRPIWARKRNPSLGLDLTEVSSK